MHKATAVFAAAAMAGIVATASLAQSLSPEDQINQRTKVQTAVALAEIAEAEGDGEALLVAARLLAGVGSVAKRNADEASEKVFYSVGDMVEVAKSLGVDAARADEVAMSSTSERGICYWDYECGTFECGWLYICE